MNISGELTGRASRSMGTAGKMSVVILLCLYLAACAGTDMRTDREVASDRVNTYLAANPGTSKEVAEAMRRFDLRKGMTPAEVMAVWGEPKAKKTFRGGQDLVWVFPCDRWPNACQSSLRLRGRGERTDDQLSPEAIFTDGRLSKWRQP